MADGADIVGIGGGDAAGAKTGTIVSEVTGKGGAVGREWEEEVLCAEVEVLEWWSNNRFRGG